jgi:hypothetical protein
MLCKSNILFYYAIVPQLGQLLLVAKIQHLRCC